MKSVMWCTLFTAGIVALRLSAPAQADTPEDAGPPRSASANTVPTIPLGPAAQHAKRWKSPDTPVALLQNLKEALDSDVLTAADFYDEANLKTFFNEPRVKWERSKLSQRLFANLDGNRQTFPGLTISIERTSYFEDLGSSEANASHERVNSHLHIDISVRELHLSADDMTAVFGRGGVVSKAANQDWQGRIGAPVELTQVQYGNGAARKVGVGRKFATFELYPNGAVREIDLVAEVVN